MFPDLQRSTRQLWSIEFEAIEHIYLGSKFSNEILNSNIEICNPRIINFQSLLKARFK